MVDRAKRPRSFATSAWDHTATTSSWDKPDEDMDHDPSDHDPDDPDEEELDPDQVSPADAVHEFIGALTELFLANQIKCISFANLCYWAHRFCQLGACYTSSRILIFQKPSELATWPHPGPFGKSSCLASS